MHVHFVLPAAAGTGNEHLGAAEVSLSNLRHTFGITRKYCLCADNHMVQGCMARPA